MADEEGKVVLLHHVQGQDRGVAGLLAGGADALGVAVGDALLDSVAGGVAVGLAAAERRSNCRGLSLGCH